MMFSMFALLASLQILFDVTYSAGVNIFEVPAMQEYIKELESIDVKKFGYSSVSETGNFTVKNLAGYKTLNQQEIYNAQIWAKYAGAAYCVNDNTIRSWSCGAHCRDGTEGTTVKQVFYAPQSATRGYVATNPNQNAIVLSFRGSIHPLNWINDVVFTTVPLATNTGVPNLSVHRGFQNTFEPVRSVVLQEIRTLMQQNPTYTVHVTGHSLGGAVANLAALALKTELSLPDDKLVLHTFAAPRTGDDKFADYLTSQGFQQYRYVNQNDIVPGLPPRFTFSYKHASPEIWFQNSQAYVCDKSLPEEDPSCSVSTGISVSALDHLRMFNTVVFGPFC